MSNGPKQAIYAEFAALAKSLGSPHRLGLLEQVAQGECGVEALAARTGLSVANTSQHLQQMKRTGLVTARRNGKSILYRLSDDSILDLIAALSRVASRTMAEVDTIRREYFDDRDALEPVSRDDLLQRLRDGLVCVIDTRPADEFAAGHVSGAINISPEDLEAQLEDLDPAVEIIAYCRGAWCVMSFEAVATLRAHGFRARRLQDGYPEWRAAGLPTRSPGAGQERPDAQPSEALSIARDL